jgi:hypothetical protein
LRFSRLQQIEFESMLECKTEHRLVETNLNEGECDLIYCRGQGNSKVEIQVINMFLLIMVFISFKINDESKIYMIMNMCMISVMIMSMSNVV